MMSLGWQEIVALEDPQRLCMTEKRYSCDPVWNQQIWPRRDSSSSQSPPHFASEEAVNPRALETDTRGCETLPLLTKSPNLSTIQFLSANATFFTEVLRGWETQFSPRLNTWWKTEYTNRQWPDHIHKDSCDPQSRQAAQETNTLFTITHSGSQPRCKSDL